MKKNEQLPRRSTGHIRRNFYVSTRPPRECVLRTASSLLDVSSSEDFFLIRLVVRPNVDCSSKKCFAERRAVVAAQLPQFSCVCLRLGLLLFFLSFCFCFLSFFFVQLNHSLTYRCSIGRCFLMCAKMVSCALHHGQLLAVRRSTETVHICMRVNPLSSTPCVSTTKAA